MKLTKSILLTSCFFLLCACGEYKLESEENETVQDEQTEARYTLQLNVTSRNNAKINYPLSLFLFDDENNCVVRETIPTEESEFSSSISKGKYTLILLSGLNENDHSYPLEIIPDSYISLKTDNCSEEPLQIGKASVNLTQSTRITVILSYAVASLNFTLNGIPQDVTATEVKVSPVSSAVSFNGDYKNDKQQCVIPCRKEGSQWVSDATYVFPNESSQTHLSINLQSPQGNEAYGYTYQATLKAGYPYHFTGNYKGGVTLDGEFQAEGWQPEIDLNSASMRFYPMREKMTVMMKGQMTAIQEIPEEKTVLVTMTRNMTHSSYPKCLVQIVYGDIFMSGRLPVFPLPKRKLSSSPRNNGIHWPQMLWICWILIQKTA